MCFSQNGFEYRQNSQLYLKECPHKTYANALESFILSVRKHDGQSSTNLFIVMYM